MRSIFDEDYKPMSREERDAAKRTAESIEVNNKHDSLSTAGKDLLRTEGGRIHTDGNAMRWDF